MKNNLLTYLTTILVMVWLGAPQLQAQRMIWPRQPKLSKAYESLERASAAVERSKVNREDIRLTNAKLELASAKRNLEEAKKNKGSSRVQAIKAITKAEEALEKAATDATQLEVVQEAIQIALKEVSDAAKAGK